VLCAVAVDQVDENAVAGPHPDVRTKRGSAVPFEQWSRSGDLRLDPELNSQLSTHTDVDRSSGADNQTVAHAVEPEAQAIHARHIARAKIGRIVIVPYIDGVPVRPPPGDRSGRDFDSGGLVHSNLSEITGFELPIVGGELQNVDARSGKGGRSSGLTAITKRYRSRTINGLPCDGQWRPGGDAVVTDESIQVGAWVSASDFLIFSRAHLRGCIRNEHRDGH
jgi:hypothetical protein